MEPMSPDPVAADGGTPEVLRCLIAAAARRAPVVLAVVWQVDGSAYVAPGTLLLFGAAGRLRGWLSGGCLERHLEDRARELIESGDGAAWVELDQRDDDALLAPSASGCRGRIRVLLVGSEGSAGVAPLAQAWLQRSGPLDLRWSADAGLRMRCGALAHSVTVTEAPWPELAAQTLALPTPPRLLLLGAGAESPVLIPLLRGLGWQIDACEQRPRWLPLASTADRIIEASPEAGLARMAPQAEDPVLLMHHDFERDRVALAALATLPPRWIGLLGPRRRRDDLLRLLPADSVAALQPRLEAPVGVALGGNGPAAIALSIAASLQQRRHER